VMTDKNLTVPEPGVRQIAYEMAFKIAREQLANIKNIEKQCRNSGARYIPAEKSIVIEYLNHTYKIRLANGEISFTDSDEDVPVRDKILILHYFTHAKGTPLTGKLITYKELQEGINYYPTFFKRAVEPVINSFKDEPERLPETAAALGGRKTDYGDIAVTFEAFAKVPLTIVLWHGDEEFPPEGNILFDSTIADYLPTEDITILCEKIAWKLVRDLKAGGDTPGHR
jgi:hypothetical protein